jgi:signal transduction histidine kinase
VVKSLLGWAALLVLMVKNADLVTNSLSIETFSLVSAVIVSDLLLLSNKSRIALSRSSQGFALAGVLLSAGTGMWTVSAYLLGTLMLSTGKARVWILDLGVCIAPLVITALVCSHFPSTPATIFGSTQLFLFLTLSFQPQDMALKTSFFTELGGPGLAVGALALVQFQPLLLVLLVPVTLGLSKAGDKNLDLLRKMHGALGRSRDRLKRGSEALHKSKKKLSQSETLLQASNELASTLDEAELRRIGGRYLLALGIGRFKFTESSPKEMTGIVHYPLGESAGFLMLEESKDEDVSRGTEVLVQLLAVHLQNARLHSRILQAMQQLKESQAQMVSQNQLAAVGRLAAGVAHEVNTPLGAIKLSVESGLFSLGKDPEKARPKLERALKAVEKAGRSVERLLYYSKPASSQPPTKFQPKVILHDCLELLDHRFRRNRVEIESEVESEMWLYGVEHDFYEMVSNLLLNAADALGSSKERRVRVALQERDETLFLTVEDSGPGVPNEIRDRVFDSFFTTKGSGRGTGLGLHLVKEVAARFKGTVELGTSSQLGGALFIVRLPGKGE